MDDNQPKTKHIYRSIT